MRCNVEATTSITFWVVLVLTYIGASNSFLLPRERTSAAFSVGKNSFIASSIEKDSTILKHVASNPSSLSLINCRTRQHSRKCRSVSKTTTTTTTTTLHLTAPSVAAMAVAAFPPLGSLLVLALIVLVHESGHYLAAKSFGITVEEFSVGVGPKVFGFEAGNDEFNIRALPLGGYVRFPENYNTTLVRELELERMNSSSDKPKATSKPTQPSKPKEQAKQQQQQQQQSKSSSSVAAQSSVVRQVFNFLTLGQLEQQRRKREEEQKRQLLKQEEEEQKQQRKFRPFWKRFKPSTAAATSSITALSPSRSATTTTSSTTITTSATTTTRRSGDDEIEIEYYDDPDLLQNRPWLQRAVVLSMGVIFNLILAYALCFGEIKWSANGLPQPVFEPGAVVSTIRTDSASRGLLQPGDVIIGINGYSISLSDSRNAQAAQQSISDLISKIRVTPDGGSVQLSVVRPPTSPSNTSPKPVRVIVQPKHLEGGKGPQSIGVMLSPNFVKTARLHSDSWIEASQLAARYVVEITGETTSGLVSLFGQLVQGQGAPAGQQVSGPIGLIRTGSEVVATKDWSSVVIFAAIISINLAVINALPLPALDGGQLVFVLAEALSGRKVDQRLQENITAVALFVLILASASFAVGDVQNLLGR